MLRVAGLSAEHDRQAAQAGLAEEAAFRRGAVAPDVVHHVDGDDARVGERSQPGLVRHEVALDAVGVRRGGPVDTTLHSETTCSEPSDWLTLISELSCTMCGSRVCTK